MSTSGDVTEAVRAHYARPDLGTMILAALEAAGKDLDRLTPEDLAPIDEFHIRGRTATLELAHAAGVDATKRVLDVGSGVGGTSRCLAREFGCRVTGIDVTEGYCRAAAMLSARTGLAELVDYRQGDATDLPFPDHSFDIVWSEHAAMNIPDKPRLYREMYRVLKPGGALAIYDVLAGPAGPVHFPVPWARTPEASFLATPDELRGLLAGSGFTVTAWSDTTPAARAWFVSLAEAIRDEGLPTLGFHVLLGSDFRSWRRISAATSRRDGSCSRRSSPGGRRAPPGGAPHRDGRTRASRGVRPRNGETPAGAGILSPWGKWS